MRVLVTYFSVSGNTELIAKGMFDALKGLVSEVKLYPIKTLNPGDVADYSLVFIGSACHGADLAKPVKEFLNGIPPSTPIKIAGFATHATNLSQGGKRNEELYERWAGRCEGSFIQACQEKGIEFLGYYHCQGKPSPEIAEFIHQEIVTEEEEWQEYIAEVNKHPDERDIQNAKVFAKGVLGKYPSS